MTLRKFYKDPDERKRYTIDYADWLDTGESVVSYVFEVNPIEVNGLEVDAASIVDNTTIVFYVALGIDQHDYTVTATATTDAGQIKQDTITYLVRSV